MFPRSASRWLVCALCLSLGSCIRPDPVNSALQRLHDPAPAVRRAAVEQLRPLHDARAVAPVIGCLQDPDPEVRQAAVATLAAWKETQAVEGIGHALQDPAPAVRIAAANALAALRDPRSVAPLVQALAVDDADLRVAAAAALGQIGGTGAEEALTSLLQKPDAPVVVAALSALGAFHDPPTVAAVIPALASKDSSVGTQAVDTLARIGTPAVEPLLDHLQNTSAQVRARAAEALGRIGDPRAVGPLVDCLKQAPPEAENTDDNSNAADQAPPVRQKAAEALGKLGAPAVEPLLACLGDADTEVCGRAADALGQIGDARAVAPLVAALVKLTGADGSNDSGERESFSQALVKLGPPVIPALAPHLSDSDESVRRAAAEVLGDLKYVPANDEDKAAFLALRESWDQLVAMGKPALPALIAALKSDATDMQTGAAEALGKLGDRRAVEPLIALLSAGGYGVSAKAAAALGALRDPRAVEPLINALGEGDEPTRTAIAAALGQLGDGRADAALIPVLKEPGADLRLAAAHALGDLKYAPEAPADKANYLIALQSWDEVAKLGAPAYEPLLALFSTDDGQARGDVVATLGKLGDPRAVGPLRDALPDWSVNADLVTSLKQLGWKPTTDAEVVYEAIAQRDAAGLKANWDRTKTALLADVESSDRRKIENAVYSFVAIGEEKILDDLVRILDDSGNTEMAETYLNSGNDKLDEAARAWAKRNGYTIIPGPGAHQASWGSF